MSGPADSPIEDYLDELLSVSAALPVRQRRALLAEVDDHLRDDAAALARAGLPVREAELAAVARFGPAATLARADHDRHRTSVGAVLRQVATTGWLLASIGAVAVGVSGLLAGAWRLFAGADTLVGAPAAGVLTSSSCARWLAVRPSASSCSSAAVADWADETVAYRIALGLAGLVAVVVFRSVVHRWPQRRLSPLVSDAIATTVSVIGAVWTLGLGVAAAVSASGDGAGQWLTASPVALAAAVFFGVRLTGPLRSLPQDGLGAYRSHRPRHTGTS